MPQSPTWTLPETLQILAQTGDGELVAELIDMFKTDTATRLLIMAEALERAEPARVKAEAHAIKGSAVQLGALSLAAICQRIELETNTQACGELVSLVRLAERDFDQLRNLQVG